MNKPTIFTHHDADGITSAYFLSLHLKEYNLVIPDEFGLTDGWKDGDYMTDMRPDNPEVKGTVYDHHPDHPPEKERKYKLIWHHYPASLITFNEFRNEIPKKEWWKVAVGLMGDGSPEYIPYEVFKEHPYLMKRIHTSTSYDKGRLRLNDYVLYKLLSSPINALCRVNREKEAFTLLKFATSPFDIIESQEAKDAKHQVSNEFSKIMREMFYMVIDDLVLVTFESDLRMAGYVATRVGSEYNDKTIMAINLKNGKISVRGDLTLYYTGLFNNNDYFDFIDISGHPGFSGGRVDTKRISDLIDGLLKLKG